MMLFPWSSQRQVFISVGWNCYPGWLIRDVFRQPAYPWDWMQFFKADSLRKMLSIEGIEEVVSDFEIKNVVSDLEMHHEKPHFWSTKYKIRSPHDHEKKPFITMENSRKEIKEKLIRRLDRLIRTARENNNHVIFLGSFNYGCYGINGYEATSFSNDISVFLETANKLLQPTQPVAILFCSPEPIVISTVGGRNNLNIDTKQNLLTPIPEITNGFYVRSMYHYEDVYFQKNPNSDKIEVMRYWKSQLKSISLTLKGVSQFT